MTRLPPDSEASPLIEYLRQPPPMYALLLSGRWGVGKSYFWNTFVREKLPGLNRVALTISAAGLTTLEELERALFMVSIQKAPGILRETSGVIGKMALRWAKIDPNDIKLKAELKTGRTVICIDDLERFAGEFDVLFGFIVSLVDDAKLHVVLIANEGEADEKYKKVKEKIVGRTIQVPQDIEKFYQDAVNNVGEIVSKSRDALREYQTEALSLFSEKGITNLRTIRGIIFEMDLILRNAEWPNDQKPNINRLFNAVTFHVMAISANAENGVLVGRCFQVGHIGVVLGIRQVSKERPGRKVVENADDTELNPLDVLIDSLGFSSDSQKWPRSDAFIALVRGNALNAKGIMDDFHVFGVEQEDNRALVRLQNRDRMTEVEFAEAVKELEDDVKNNRFTAVMDIWLSWEMLYGLSTLNLTRFSPQDCAEFFLSAIEGTDGSSLDDATLQIYPEQRDEAEGRVLKKVRVIANAVSARLESAQGQVVLSQIIAGKADAADAFRKSIFSGITPEALFDRLRETRRSSIINVSRFVGQRRSLANAREMFGDELPFAEAMVRLIAETVKEARPMTMVNSALLDLGRQFQAFAKELNPSQAAGNE
ncbi:MAG: P-loop NTPase fold protein [Dyella sp.]|uniref:P-loop NTPase fold protein n=1 Tax=Dyella sp. TaxID=1869338 RepID=UPI003F7D27C8